VATRSRLKLQETDLPHATLIIFKWLTYFQRFVNILVIFAIPVILLPKVIESLLPPGSGKGSKGHTKKDEQFRQLWMELEVDAVIRQTLDG
jgi:hypothetical protein